MSIVARRVAERGIVQRVAGPMLDPAHTPHWRAALTLVCAQIGTDQSTLAIHAAAAVELIHAATSVHDDLIDEAQRRTGAIAPRVDWDGDISLMVGDYLLALAASEMALAPDPRIISVYSRAVMRICEGQLAPVTRLSPTSAAVEQYLYRAGCKTAALFEAACKAGGVCGGCTDEQIEVLGRYGYQFGLAVQITSDVTALDEDLPARRTGATLRAGQITLPLIYASEHDPTGTLAELIDRPPLSDDQLRVALALVRRTGAIERAQEDAYAYAERACAALTDLPPGPAVESLITMAYAVVRE